MALLNAQSLTFQFENGEVLFTDLTFSLDNKITGLVGRNGSGKSLLASILGKERLPNTGAVLWHGRVGILPQLTDNKRLSLAGNIAEFLGLSGKLLALERVEAGSCEQADFDIIGEDWCLFADLCSQLELIGLPSDPSRACNTLSGGELTRLLLWKLFRADHDLLILDEPSNHMDLKGKRWLLQQMQQFEGGILLISHDRQLLSSVDEIMELTSLGLRHYSGNYAHYYEQKSLETSAIERGIASTQQQIKSIRHQSQRSHEKAQQRAAQGEKARKSGSQPKILLDAKKNAAQNSTSSRNAQFENQLSRAKKKLTELKTQHEAVKPQQLSVNQSEKRQSRMLDVIEGKLPFGYPEAMTFSVDYGDKIHLTGSNGSGKSTLLKAILGQLKLSSGQVQSRSKLCYLDQHFSLLSAQDSMLDNLRRLCPHYVEAELRTLLAGVGFRRESVYKPVSQLSGGEKMKLAMLVVSHQQGDTLLLLDEPDNHLDIDSKQMLAQALRVHCGSLILISHDEAFVEESGINRVVSIG